MFWRWVRVQPGLFWAYDDSWGWMHLGEGFGGLCRMERAIAEASTQQLPFLMVSSRTGAVLFDWRLP